MPLGVLNCPSLVPPVPQASTNAGGASARAGTGWAKRPRLETARARTLAVRKRFEFSMPQFSARNGGGLFGVGVGMRFRHRVLPLEAELRIRVGGLRPFHDPAPEPVHFFFEYGLEQEPHRSHPRFVNATMAFTSPSPARP